MSWLDPAKKKSVAGEGGFGCTYRGVHKRTGQVVAVKMFPAHNEYRSECMHEVALYNYIAGLDVHRRFLHVLESGHEAPIPYLVLPWAGLSLSGYLKQQVHEATARIAKLDRSDIIIAVAIQTADALCFLHQNGVAHTDIKPGNLMIQGDTMNIVIIDFNAAERFDQQGDWLPRRTTYTTYPYRAPELWTRKHHRLPQVLVAADIWSYGVTCIETIRGGVSLFGGHGSETKTEKIIGEFVKSTGALDKLVATLPRVVGPLSNIHQIARCALQVNPSERSLCDALAESGR